MSTGWMSQTAQPRAPQPQAGEDARTRTMRPIVTGTSVLGIKFDGGVAIAADTLGSYGSLARFREISRMCKVGNQTVVGGGGDVADFHMIRDLLNTLEIENREYEDEHDIKPQAVHTYLTRVLYNRRSQMNPLWNTVLVAGMQDGEPYLGYTDKLGVAYQESTLACGYGAYIALGPLLREVADKGEPITKDAAVALLQKCLKVLWYRDARSLNRFEIATVTAEGVDISAPQSSESDWGIASMVRGYE
ncbi:proteasome subunit beta type [Salpingoeca rosetta]|uniref:Proteasome subunit beta n=1 Tax=Salpingoeca rosetta (strain ATCC 50818 / BSB-021) TaxID=946362 RepID=F2UE58_SALR5|nr:proteasome subunit beta type [Salpingoeca rosetta]EGD74908.1 proteasome subunit beta type [Salpingoeca rosetta]|eukprot:XP_004992553.1 proteasome subunit beta type [Salpingoeca rosetta]